MPSKIMSIVSYVLIASSFVRTMLAKITDFVLASKMTMMLDRLNFSMKNQRARRRLLINSLTKGVLDFGKEEADQQLKC